MKPNTSILIAATISIATLVIPTQLAAQHTRYKLIDLGTFGGPLSSTREAQARVINNRSMVVGGADTSIPNPNVSNPCLFCSDTDPFLMHAFQWQKDGLTDLGALPGINTSFAGSVSDSGLSVGWSSDNDHMDPLLSIPQMHATSWKDGEIVDLGTLEGGYESVALAVNNRGQVVGVSANLVPDPFGPLGTQNRIFLWQNGVMEDLNTLGGPDAGFLDLVGDVEINERGQVAACSYTNSTANPVTGTPTLDPFLWQHGEMRDLGTLGGTSGCAVSLNNRGQVVGYSNLAGDLTFQPFLWDQGSLINLGTFGGDNGIASWINDAGHVVGKADVTEICTACAPGNQKQLHHPFLWRHGVMTDLGLIDGDTAGTAFSINSKDQIVGRSVVCTQINPDDGCDGPVQHAFLWEKGSIYDLQSLVVPSSDITLNDVTHINERGEIAASGVLPNGDTHAVLLVPCGKADEDCASAASSTTLAAEISSVPTAENRAKPSARHGESSRTKSMWHSYSRRRMLSTPSVSGSPNEALPDNHWVLVDRIDVAPQSPLGIWGRCTRYGGMCGFGLPRCCSGLTCAYCGLRDCCL